MSTINHVMRRLFPSGTRGSERDTDLGGFPLWPPDAFGLAATLVNQSGCYALARYTLPGRPDSYGFDPRMAAQYGAGWGAFPSDEGGKTVSETEAHLQQLWDVLHECSDCEVTDDADPRANLWRDAALELLIISDCACQGFGFIVPDPGRRPFADIVVEQHKLFLDESDQMSLPYLPVSLCNMIPPEELCVQPKSRTPQTGCTMRSLTHHLSLLPAKGEVATSWLFGLEERDLDLRHDRPINLLIVPFPYRIEGTCFSSSPTATANFFSLKQRWLGSAPTATSAQDFAGFLKEMIDVAKSDVGKVHGVVLPEFALEKGLAAEVGRQLAGCGLEFFITGVSSSTAHGLPRNCAYSRLYSFEGEPYLDWEQAKHHRWKLDRDQIRRYHLGDRLNPEEEWWEHICVEKRECRFYVFRAGMTLATLICEDLARIDPVQTVIRAVGPNLVVALLMDGPQLEKRWSGRYATVLADDPGSAVLTVTSLGMLKRSVMPGEPEPREIALWKGSEGFARELRLLPQCQGLLLTLSVAYQTHMTMDGRSDNGATYGLYLSGAHSVRHPNPPTWAAA